MNYSLVVLFSFSIAIAAIIGLVRFKKINPAYYPFIYCLWLGLINETISYILARTIGNNSINNNIYILFESLLITWQFQRWGIFGRSKILFPGVLLLFVIFWIIENFFIFTITQPTFYFPIFYSFIIVLMSINIINGLIVRERKNFLKSPVFLICIGFVSYFTLRVLMQTFWLYGDRVSLAFRISIAYSLIYVNLFANFIYALAVLWMPTKQRFTLPS